MQKDLSEWIDIASLGFNHDTKKQISGFVLEE